MAKAKPTKIVDDTASSASGSGTTPSKSNTTSRSRKQNALDTLRTDIPHIFQESQKTAANHRKNAIKLRKIQEQCSELNGENGEAAFNKEFIRNLNVVLAIKKKEPAADKVIQFVSSFILCTREKDIANATNEEEEAEGISSRFVEHLMRHLLKGVRVKEKQVRLRSCQLIALSTNSLGAMDDDLYTQLKDSLMERVKDKESAVRVQAVFALSKLQSGEEDEAENVDEENVVQVMIDLMQHDPSADVRRSALFNIEHTKKTLPYILERARDTDPYNRRGVFSKPMEEIPDFRVLSIGDREKLLRYGLSDRDAGVKKACTKMLATRWIQQADDNLLEFLERLDVMSSNVADDVLQAFFAYRGDILGGLVFNDVFWVNLTVESAFLVRAYAEYCHKAEDDLQFEKAVPEVTRHAFYIQKYSNAMQEADEEDRPEAEFIVTQLLMIAKLLDYADENGRRKMFNLLREMLMLDDIPDKHLDCIVETMGRISLNEKDFTRIVIEIISDIRASIDEQEYLRNPEAEGSEDEDDSPDEQTLDLTETPRKRKRSVAEKTRRRSLAMEEVGQNTSELDAMLTRVRCLTITKFMLQRSTEPLKENSYMYGLLNELVIPALARQEEVMQELGLQCLGLICALDQTLAQSNMELFLTCIFAEQASDQLHQLSLKIVFDLLLTFGMTAMSEQISEDRIIGNVTDCLEGNEPELQAIAAEGLCKLMLTRMLKNPAVLEKLIILYFDPVTAENYHLRQCLNYFMQVYFHSSHDNQVTLSKIFVPTLTHLIQKYNATDRNAEMPTPVVIAQQMLEWCEPRRVLGADADKGPVVNSGIDFGLQANIALELVKEMFKDTEEVEKATRKFLPSILFKTRVDAEAGEERLKKLSLLIGNLKARRPITEKSGKKHLQSVEKNILKFFEDAPEALDEAELAKLNELMDEISFVEQFDFPDEPVEPVAPTPSTKRGGRTKPTENAKLSKMLQEVDAMLESSDEDEDLHTLDMDEDEDDEMEGATTTHSKAKDKAKATRKPAPKKPQPRPKPKARSRGRKVVEESEESEEEEEQEQEEEEEEEVSEEELTRPIRSSRRGQQQHQQQQQQQQQSTVTRSSPRKSKTPTPSPIKPKDVGKGKKMFSLDDGEDEEDEDEDEEDEEEEEEEDDSGSEFED